MQCFENGGVKTNGKPCKRHVKPGFLHCNQHGGEPVAAKLKAEMALATARMPAIEALLSIIERFNERDCPTCGNSTADMDETGKVIRACQIVLDRTGLGPHSTMELTAQSDGSVDIRMATVEERAECLGIFARLAELKALWRARTLGPTAHSPIASGSATVM